MNLDDYKYNRANITAFSLVKTYSPFYKSISLNLTDYYPVSGKDNEKTNALLFVRLRSVCPFIALRPLKHHSFPSVSDEERALVRHHIHARGGYQGR